MISPFLEGSNFKRNLRAEEEEEKEEEALFFNYDMDERQD